MTSDRLVLPTRVGRAEHGENSFFGFSVGAELAGRTVVWSALSLAVGYRTLTFDECAILDDMVVCSLAADPHIWPLKATRLLSSFGRFLPGLVAGMLCTSGGFMGWGTYAPAARFLQAFARADDPAAVVEETLATVQHVPGFGIAFRTEDERVVAFRPCVESRGFERGIHWKALCRAESIMRARRAPMNIASASAAVLLDIGFEPAQIDALGPLVLLPNYLANAVEGARQQPEVLRRLPPNAIDDRTPPPRESPRAARTKRSPLSEPTDATRTRRR